MFLLIYMENGFAVTVLRAEGSPGISLKRETGTGVFRVWKASSQNVGLLWDVLIFPNPLSVVVEDCNVCL